MITEILLIDTMHSLSLIPDSEEAKDTTGSLINMSDSGVGAEDRGSPAAKEGGLRVPKAFVGPPRHHYGDHTGEGKEAFSIPKRLNQDRVLFKKQNNVKRGLVCS